MSIYRDNKPKAEPSSDMEIIMMAMNAILVGVTMESRNPKFQKLASNISQTLNTRIAQYQKVRGA